MATVGFPDRKTVINVLTQGKELANELKRKLSSEEACDFLVQRIVSSYENALTLLPLIGNGDSSQRISVANSPESPNSVERTFLSEGSDQSSKNFKKRKTMSKWSEQVRVTEFESQLDDGYSWRKYGQKDILGAHHPRAYYRCTHRNTQGCLATKLVQRADDDPSATDVTYRGKHSCRQERLKQKKEIKKEDETLIRHSQQIPKSETQQISSQEEHFPAFSFHSTPIESKNAGSSFFLESSNFIGTDYSSPFLSPATSDSYFSLNDFGIGHSLQGSESDFAEIISNPTPFTNFSFGDMDINISIDSSDLLKALDGFL